MGMGIVATFTESGAQSHRDGQLASYLTSAEATEAAGDHLDELAGGIRQDTARVAELIWNADSLWACDAIAHAMATGDWLFVQHQAEKHVQPLIRAAAEEDADAQSAAAKEIRGEALFEARQDARAFA